LNRNVDFYSTHTNVERGLKYLVKFICGRSLNVICVTGHDNYLDMLTYRIH